MIVGTADAQVRGLSREQVAERIATGQVNALDDSASRSLWQILRGNIFTLFNAILSIALFFVLLVGAWKDALFGFVLIFNTLIGTVTEYRAKYVLDRLSILHQDEVTVIRAGQEDSISASDVVLGDVVKLSLGDQIPADGKVLTSSGLEVDESMLTGESDPVYKQTGDDVLSGSSVTAGSALFETTAVGSGAYAQRLTSAARRFSLVRSELRTGINKVLVFVSWIIVPIALLLFWSQIRDQGGFTVAFSTGTWREAVVQAVAGIVGMVPEGLVLLTSVNFALAALILARHGVLTQELPAVEVLARVDVLCLDKTGTITDGTMILDQVVEFGAGDHRPLITAIAAGQSSPTTDAIIAGLQDLPPVAVTEVTPFSSARKWSCYADDADQHWYFGAPEVLMATSNGAATDEIADQVREFAQTGARVLLLARTAPNSRVKPSEATQIRPGAAELPRELSGVALVVVREQIRPDAPQTLDYFASQGVEVKVISGDNTDTVAAIAQRVGLGGDGRLRSVDARTLPATGPELAEAVRANTVFGRVTPEQKREFVKILQEQGRTVAMTGDGVNDALALKDADLGIAMAGGAPATKAVARLVLLNGAFSALPPVVAQGRRVIANIERVASLFLTKTTYAVILAIVVMAIGIEYPFLPRHLTLVSVLTIGTPAFILALAPNNQRYTPGFLDRVLRLAVPAGITAAVAIMTTYLTLHARGIEAQANTGATLVLLIIGLWLLGALARPWRLWRIGLVATMAAIAIYAISSPFVRDVLALEWPQAFTMQLVGVMGSLGAACIEVIFQIHRRHVRSQADVTAG